MNARTLWLQGQMLLAACCICMLWACSGGSEDPAPAPPTALPAALTVKTPTTRQDVNSDVAFTSNAVDPNGKLKYLWEFADGSSSTLASPSHRFAKSGIYVVNLILTNEAGESVYNNGTVLVGDLAIVRGLQCSKDANDGWCKQYLSPQFLDDAITDISWIDARRGWAVSGSGFVSKTTDAGVTWQVQNSGVQRPLLKVNFINDKVGWIAGANGLVLRTADGGATWRASSLGTGVTAPPEAIGVVDASTAWVSTLIKPNPDVMGYSEVFVTRDAGATWTQVSRPTGKRESLIVAGNLTAWTWADFTDKQGCVGTFLAKSTDYGAHWLESSVRVSNGCLSMPSSTPDEIQFVDELKGLAVRRWYNNGGRDFMGTLDGGKTWVRVGAKLPPSARYWPREYRLAADGTLFWWQRTDLLIVDGPPTGKLDYSTDLGVTWRQMPLPSASPDYYDYNQYVEPRFYSSESVALTTREGRELITVDAGRSWSERRSPKTTVRPGKSLWFFDAREGLVLTDEGNFLRTTDGGQTWTGKSVSEVPKGQAPRRMEFLSDNSTGWLITGTSELFKTTDKGKTWSRAANAALGYKFLNFHFVDASYGWALVNVSNQDARILVSSTNGGASWQQVASAPSAVASATALRFADRKYGVVMAEGKAMLTTDGGLTWKESLLPSKSAIYELRFADADRVMGVGEGGTVLWSESRGVNWTLARPYLGSDEDLYDLHFFSDTLGYAAGPAGVMFLNKYSSRLVGERLNQRLPGDGFGQNQTFRSAFFVDEFTGWWLGTAGSTGIILATISGGN
jgi:photosystem II stability/assembly factor-like uncharacterized protein